MLQRGDRVFSQLLDPYNLPPLRTPPQRVAYEHVIAGDPAALALLKDRIVLVGTLLPQFDRMQLPWPAANRWGVELFAAQIDAMARSVVIRPIHPIAEWALMTRRSRCSAHPSATDCASARARCGSRRWRRSRSSGSPSLIAWYRFERQLIGVPYDIAALSLGAWLANRTWERTPA